jgi:hypothetical protein
MIVGLPRMALNSARRVIVWCALVGFVGGTVGVPVPRLLSDNMDRSRPFPCQDHHCGCATADQCWRSCCCLTNRQKLAWAEAHGVTPPTFVVAAAAGEQDASPRAASCCGGKRSAACGKLASSCCTATSPVADDSAVVLDWVLAIEARRCQGQAEQWLALGALSLPPAGATWTPENPCCGELQAASPRLVGVLSAPHTPPPRA